MQHIYTKIFFPLLLLFHFLSQANAQNDFGIRYVRYPAGQSFTNDTIRFEYEITNYGPNTVPQDSLLNVQLQIDEYFFALDLLGQGPTPISVPTTLAPNQSFIDDKGYLLGPATVSYLQRSAATFCLIVYGRLSDPVDTLFPNDPNPGNNKTCLSFSNGQITALAQTSAIQHSTTSFNVDIFPNPTAGALNIDCHDSSVDRIEIYDILGQLVWEEKLAASNVQLSLSGLKTGIYGYILYGNHKRLHSGKIIKQ
jgi:hypothetical protein